ncbi:MAG: mechanosensitive ion channel domain-containing protein [Chloroflexota bacterium]
MIMLLFTVLGAVTYLAYDFIYRTRVEALPWDQDPLRYLLAAAFVSFGVVTVRILSYLLIDVAFVRLRGKEPSQLLRLVVATLLFGIVAALILGFVIGADVAAILTSTAILTAVIGFGLQATLGNVFEGLSVQIHQPFHIGDRIEIGEYYGIVTSLTWRAIMVLQEDDTIVTIPNNMLANGPIRVFPAEQTVRASVQFPAPIDVPPRRVTNIVSEAISSSTEIVGSRRPEVLVHELAPSDSAVIYEARFWVFPEKEIEMMEAHVRERVWYALARAGIPMPAGIEATVDNFKIPLIRTNTHTLLNEKDDLIVMSSVALFEGIPIGVVSEVLTLGVRLIFAPGEQIAISGVSRYSLFVVMRGMASVPLPLGTVEVEEATMHAESYWQPEVLERVRQQYAEYMGPMSGYLVRNYARTTSDPFHLYRLLAEDIPTEAERSAFLALGPSSPAREIEPGQFFGERAAFLGEALTVENVRAVSEVEIIEVSNSALRSVLKANPDVIGELSRNLAAFLFHHRNENVSVADVRMGMIDHLGTTLDT